MAEDGEGGAVEVVCPHCKKPFTSKLIGDGAGERYRGFKCPHCKLFVPERHAAQGAGADT